jgi:EF hand
MGPAASTALGIVVGLIVFLATAMMGVIAVNGVNNPGISSAEASAAAGSTAPDAQPKDGSFASLDLNGDGRLSLAEVTGNGDIVARFHRADRNRDGKLTSAEFDRLAKLPPPKERPKPKSQIRRDAESQLAASRRGG